MTPDIEWTAQASPNFSVFSHFSSALSKAHEGWSFKGVDVGITSDRALPAYVKKYSFGRSFLTDILALPMNGWREGKLEMTNYLAISYVVDGDGYQLDVCGKRYSLKRGNVFVWNTSQQIYFESSQAVRQLSIFIPLGQAFNVGKLVCKDKLYVLDESETISNILRSILLTLRKNAHKTCISDELFIINPVIELTCSSISKRNAFQLEKKRGREQWLVEIQDYVRNNLFDADLCVASISQALGISKRYIHQIYSAETESLSRWISRHRLEQAARYLKDESFRGVSITDIALMSGFNDSGYFSRQFKMEYSQTPREYRLAALADH